MNMLAIDTSMQACSAAVLSMDKTSPAFSIYEEIERGHAERLMGMIDEVLRKTQTPIAQIDKFAVCRGPGTFTGVRIAIATARGLALARQKPVVGIGTLKVLAARVLYEQKTIEKPLDQALGIAVDARRGEIYWQLFAPDGQPLEDPVARAPQQIAADLNKRRKPITLAGSGAQLIAAHLDPAQTQWTCTHAALQPHAARLGELALAQPLLDKSPQQRVTPLYLRPADAKIQTGYAIERR